MAYLFVLFAGILAAQQPTRTQITLTVAQHNVLLGAPASFTATVTPSSSPGVVTFWEGVEYLGSAWLDASGRAALDVRMQHAGRQIVRAAYPGSGDYLPAYSNTVTVIVRAVRASAFLPVDITPQVYGRGGAIADFNGDLFLDVITPRRTLLGSSSGAFSQLALAQGLAYPQPGDFNLDGRVDVVAQHIESATRRTAIAVGNGDGSFQALQPFASNWRNSSTEFRYYVVDANRDGRPDVLTPGYESFTVELGNGDGSLQIPHSYASRQHCSDLGCEFSPAVEMLVADVNSDGNADVVAAGTDLFYGRGDGTFDPPQWTPGHVWAVADFNGDDRADLLLLGGQSALNNSDGTFRLTASPSIPPGRIHVIDFDGDGVLDLLFWAPGGIRVFAGNGDGTFRLALRLSEPVERLTVTELNGDGMSDLVVQRALAIGGIFITPPLRILYGTTQSPMIVSPTELNAGAAAGSTAFTLTVTRAGTPWNVAVEGSAAAWIAPNTWEGTGSGTLTFTYAANTSVNPRTASLVISDKTVRVTQAGVQATLTLNPAGATVATLGFVGSIAVTSSAGDYAWTVSSNVAWITIMGGASRTGSGTVEYLVAPNAALVPRTGVITIGDKTFTVTQAGTSVVLNPAQANVRADAGTGSFMYSAGVTPQLASPETWLRVTGVGQGVVFYAYDANPSPQRRTGTIRAGNAAFTLTQLGTANSVALLPNGVVVPAIGGTNTVAVTASSGMFDWGTYPQASWLTHMRHGFDRDDKVLTYYVEPNPTDAPRTSSLLIGGQTFTVTQNANPCPLTVSGDGRFPMTGGTRTFTINRSSPCTYDVSIDAPWVTIQPAAGAAATVTVNVFPNGITARQAVLVVGATRFIIKQAGQTRTGVFRDGIWRLDQSGNGTVDGTFFVESGQDVPVTGDWNGNGSINYGVFRNGTWLLDHNGDRMWHGGEVDRVYSIGQAGDTPLTGDWNGDGRDKIGFFRNGMWLLDYNGNGGWDGPEFDRLYWIGQAGDVPLVGDWNGDGRAEIGFFRNGMWLLDYNGNGAWDGPSVDRLHWIGQAGDTPLVGDWNGDGRTEIGFFRAGMWLLDYNGNGGWEGPAVDRLHWIGQAGDTPLTGDWSGDGRSKIGIFRPNAVQPAMWLLDFNGNGAWDGTSVDSLLWYGSPADKPVTGSW